MDSEFNQSNELIHEKSPYLLQHAYNPVHWYPWGKEAFEKAKEQDKPIFLSIGYSTCHWCHVMAHESFEDFEVAELLNKDYISIKVDKEERPDIDSVYMKVCQSLTGSGGWPLTIIMTPEQRPFYAGTYFPKDSRYHMIGLLDLLKAISEQWKTNRRQLLHSSNTITEAMQELNGVNEEKLSKNVIFTAQKQLFQSFDSRYGGFGKAPKFPTPHNLLFLLQHSIFEKNSDSLKMAEKTLQQMYRGGIFDHIGYGFSRYSTDNKWLIPHFEKMLYDNALLIIAYLQTYQITHLEFYKMVTVKTLTYILREMTDEEGGFYSAQDADSDGEEGKYYALTKNEIFHLLGMEDGEYFCQYFGITETGNFEGKSIPNLIQNDSFESPNEKIEELIPKVYQYRLSRTKLHKDDKILTSWNALMIVAFCKAYQILDEEEYLSAAQKAMSFIQNHLTDKQGNLFVRYREGEATEAGNLDDYSFTVWALISLYDVTFDENYLQSALEYGKKLIQEFWDEENGGFYMTSHEAEQLIFRPKVTYGGAMPSGNSVAAYCLAKLSHLTANSKISEYSFKQQQFLAGEVKEYPSGYSFALLALMWELYPTRNIVCVMNDNSDKELLKKHLQKFFLPNTTILVKDASNTNQIEKIAEFTKEYHTVNGKSAYYICENKVCSPPIFTMEELKKRLSY